MKHSSMVEPDPMVVSELRDTDVLFGRGAPHIFYIGNLRFRDLVSKRKADFMNTGRHHIKKEIAEEIYQAIEQSNGRFLRKIKTKAEARKYRLPEDTDGWVVVDKKTSMRKVKQALREDDTRRHAQADDSQNELARASDEAKPEPPVDTNLSSHVPPAARSQSGFSNQIDDHLARQQDIYRLQQELWQQEQMQHQYGGLLSSYNQYSSEGLSALSQYPQGMFASHGQGHLSTAASCNYFDYSVAPLAPTEPLVSGSATLNESRIQSAIRGMIQRQESDRAKAQFSRNLMSNGVSYPSANGMYNAGLGLQGRANVPVASPAARITEASMPRLVTPARSSRPLSNPSTQSTLPFLDLNFAEVQGPSKKRKMK